MGQNNRQRRAAKHRQKAHADGWRAGRAAADRAQFDVRDSLASRAS